MSEQSSETWQEQMARTLYHLRRMLAAEPQPEETCTHALMESSRDITRFAAPQPLMEAIGVADADGTMSLCPECGSIEIQWCEDDASRKVIVPPMMWVLMPPDGAGEDSPGQRGDR